MVPDLSRHYEAGWGVGDKNRGLSTQKNDKPLILREIIFHFKKFHPPFSPAFLCGNGAAGRNRTGRFDNFIPSTWQRDEIPLIARDDVKPACAPFLFGLLNLLLR